MKLPSILSASDKPLKDQMPQLGGTHRDVVVSLSKGIVGAIPDVGSFFAELIGMLIPEQRAERIEIYVQLLNDRVGRLEEADLKSRLNEPENIDLFEEGAFQSIRALSNERKEHISNLVADGITGQAKERVESKRLLNLLRELDDAEIIILSSMLHKNQEDEEFFQRHTNILMPVAPSFTDSQEVFDAETIQKLADAHLVRLGLLKLRFKQPSRNEAPAFDESTGTLKSSGTELTSLGRLLLRKIGVAEDEEF